MKFTIARNDLVDLLARTGKIVASKNIVPILGNVMIAASDGEVRLTSNNWEMEVTARGAAQVEMAGATTVPHHLIDSIARGHAKGAEIGIEAGEQMLLRCGRSRAKLLTLPASDFPALETGEWTSSFSVPCDDLRRLINAVGYAVGNEASRYYLMGALLCCLTKDGGSRQLCMVATTGHLLAAAAAPCPAGAEALQNVIIPTAALTELGRMAKAQGEQVGDVALSFNTRKLRAVFADGTTLVSKLIEGTYPDWQQVVRGLETSICATLDKDVLEATLARIAPMVNRTTRNVMLTIAPDLLTMTASSMEAGEIHEEIACEADGSWSGSVQSIYLSATLAAVPADVVDLRVGAGMAVFLYPHGRREPTFLVALRKG